MRSVFFVTLIPCALSHFLCSACALVNAAVLGKLACLRFGVDILITRDIGYAIRWQVLPNSRASIGKTNRACSPSFNRTYCVRGGAPSSSLYSSPPR